MNYKHRLFLSIFIFTYFVPNYKLFHQSTEQKMNQLFTFNSQQLQTLTKRPSSTDNTPQFRKRIICSKFSKKQSLLSQASTHADISASINGSKPSPMKKVQFNLDNPIVYDACQSLRNRSFPHKEKTMNKSDNNNEIETDCVQLEQKGRYPLIQIADKIKVNQLGRRSLMAELDEIKQIEDYKNEQVLKRQVGSVRQKRVFSLKINPKIVPISERKLPKAFKINCLNPFKKIERKHFHDQQIRDDQLFKNLGKIRNQMSTKSESTSRIEKNYELDAKIYQWYSPGER